MTAPFRNRWNVSAIGQVPALMAHLSALVPPYTVTIKMGEETRRDRQNRLAFDWYKQIGQQLDGWDASDARAYCKLYLGVRLMRQESGEFRDTWNRLIRDRFTTEEKLELMLDPHDYPVTRIMTVKQMTEYLNRVRDAFTAQGVVLTDPEARKYEGANS